MEFIDWWMRFAYSYPLRRYFLRTMYEFSNGLSCVGVNPDPET